MTTPTRIAFRLIARTSLAVVVLSFAVFGAWTAGGLGRQPAPQRPRVEEEEDAPKAKTPPGKKKRVEEEEEAPRSKPKRKVQVEDEEDAKTKSETGRPSQPAASGDLAQLAEQAAHPALKDLFRSLAVPHDRVLFKRSSVTIGGERIQREDNVEPVPLYLGDDPGRYHRERLQFTPLTTTDWKPLKPYSPDLLRLESVRPYEEIAQDKVRRFLRAGYEQKEPGDRLYLSRSAMLAAAEQVLSAVLRWHESAIQTGKRRGKEWEEVEKNLRKQLLDEVQLEQMKVFAQAKDWEKVLELTRRLAGTYSSEAERERIFRPVADMIRSALFKDDPTISESMRQQVRKRLHDLEREFPGNQAIGPLGEMLRAEAEGLLKTAQELARDKEDAQKLQQARRFLDQAKETWPQLPGLHELEVRLGMEYPVLRVGVRGELPKYFSPAWAVTDNERRAVEMLFESLVKLVPDGAGGFRYRQGLAESPPQVVALGRQFDLPRNAVWSDGRQISSADVDFSLKQLQAGMGVGRSRVWGDLLAAVERQKDPFQVTLRMNQGFLDPLAPMTFKILPVDRQVNSEAFAQNPVTSGPFLLGPHKSDEKQRDCLFFTANPSYGLRPSKRNTPHIQEIRFYSYAANTNVAEELRSGRLDLVLDLTAKEAEELRQKPDIVVPMPAPNVPNRRIYFLAINTSKLDKADLRQALSCAIDREALLDKHFRASLKTPLHKALSGPFPAGSWACKQDNKANLYDPEAAKLLKNQQSVLEAAKATPLKLKYADDNPALKGAMEDLCAQVKELTGVVLEPTPCSPYQLREDVEVTKNYDLAYYHYDFLDESYWLVPLLGPPPGTEEVKNIFKFQDMKLAQLLEGTKNYRNFAEVRKYQWEIHELLNHQMPFIPLWQLDPLLAYRRDVQPAALDPLLLFGNIEHWRLRRQ